MCKTYELRMNECSMIFIPKLWDVKFVISTHIVVDNNKILDLIHFPLFRFMSLWTFCKVYFMQMPQMYCKITNLTKYFMDEDC
jgi:hypothetical protein